MAAEKTTVPASVRNPYLRCYFQAKNLRSGDTYKLYEFILWIDAKHDEFRKAHGIPDHKEYNEQEQDAFIEFLEGGIST